MITWGKNLGKPRLPIKHSDLKRYGDSTLKSVCPTCGEGMLLLRRSLTTMALEENDQCTFCAQKFYYLDIVALRRLEGKVDGVR